MLGKINDAVRQFGVFAGVIYLADRALSTLSPRCRLYFYELMVQPIRVDALPANRFLSGIEIREIPPGDPERARMPVRPEVMQARIAQAATCLGAYKKGELIGYMWFCADRYDEDEVRCTYVLERSRESVFDFDFYLYPEHRMGLGFVALWQGANRFLSERGIRFTFSRLTRFNIASRRSHAHLGWKLVGRTWFLQLGRIEIMVSTLRPYFHVSISPSRRVSLALRPDVLET